MKDMIVIGGRKGSGKSTSAKYIVQYAKDRGISAFILGFSFPMKDMAIRYFGLDAKLVYGTQADKEQPSSWRWGELTSQLRCQFMKKKDDPVTIREFLQLIGSEVFRQHFSEHVWKKAVHNEVDQGPEGAVYIVEDGRLPAELERHPSLNVKTTAIVIRRPDLVVKDVHSTENALDNISPTAYDYLLTNDKGILDLYKKLDMIMSAVLP